MTSYDVTIEQAGGPDRTIAVGERETILEAGLRAGIRLPSDCRTGTCTTCVGRVVAIEDGDAAPAADADEADAAEDGADDVVDAATAVDYKRPPKGLTERERAEGYALLCIALPRADCRIRVGPRVRSAVGDSPWM